jgi:hypothetical protein
MSVVALLYVWLALWLLIGIFVAGLVLLFLRFIWRTYRFIQKERFRDLANAR